VLTAMTEFWDRSLLPIAPTHLIHGTDSVVTFRRAAADLNGTSPGRADACAPGGDVAIECIVRGYITGSAWKEYGQSGTDARHRGCRIDLRESDRLPTPVFTPSTKAISGHDVNISYEESAELIGAKPRRTGSRHQPRRLSGRSSTRPRERHRHR